MKSNYLAILTLSAIFTVSNSFAQEEKIDVHADNETISAVQLGTGVGTLAHIGGSVQTQVKKGISLGGSLEIGMDKQPVRNAIGGTNPDNFNYGIVGQATIGPVFDAGFIHFNPILMIQCQPSTSRLPDEEKDKYGCGPRAGARVFLGNRSIQLGFGVNKALTKVDNGQDGQIEIMLKVPFTDNSDRGNDPKLDMDFDKTNKQETAAGAIRA